MALLKAAGVLVVLRPSSFELLPIARARSKLGFFPGGGYWRWFRQAVLRRQSLVEVGVAQTLRGLPGVGVRR